MITLISFCDISWFCVFLSWLLPFLLGLLLGWLIWSRFKSMYNNLYSKHKTLKNDHISLEEKYKVYQEKLRICEEKRNEHVSKIALLEGMLDECKKGQAQLMKTKEESQKMGITVPQPETQASASIGIKADKFAVLKEDNLQVIEGIGPKLNKFLNSKGINRWSDIASKNPKEIKDLLASEGNKYRIIDPETWVKQAKLANEGKWNELIALQKVLDTGKTNQTSEETDSKVEKMLIKMGVIKKWKKDDLRAIEGIGPKIASLLNNAGINTWKKLADTSVEQIQKILDNAGKRYTLADPGTWPKQATMAHEGKWEELEEYQDFLQGGKE